MTVFNRTSMALLVVLLSASVTRAEIIHVNLGDMHLDPTRGTTTITNGPFISEFLHIPCGDLPPGIWGPPCIVANCGLFGSVDTSPLRLTAGDPIDPSLTYRDESFLVDYIVSGNERQGFRFEIVENDWLDSGGDPVRGYLAFGGSAEDANATHYGWIDLTVDYDPLINLAHVVLHGYAYESEPNVPIRAGMVPEPASTLPLLVGAFCIFAHARKRFAGAQLAVEGSAA